MTSRLLICHFRWYLIFFLFSFFLFPCSTEHWTLGLTHSRDAPNQCPTPPPSLWGIYWILCLTFPLSSYSSGKYKSIWAFLRETWRLRVNQDVKGLWQRQWAFIQAKTYSTFSWSTRSIRYLPSGFMSLRIKAMMISIPLDSWVAIQVWKRNVCQRIFYSSGE